MQQYLFRPNPSCCISKGHANVIFATGASQFNFINYLISIGGVPWDKVTTYYLDEYVGLSGGEEHPASFQILERRLLINFNQPSGKYTTLTRKLRRVRATAKRREIDLACIRIGENGHVTVTIRK